ncbi:MAG: Endolytic murein transglycosylase [Polaribacter sp. SA4-10]|nr:MAG: Endolytic murein transglycosylase [Polaribacter sp. SA4-10]
MNKKIILFGILIIVLIGGMISLQYYNRIFADNIRKTGSIFIESKDDLSVLKKRLAPFLENKEGFNWVAVQKEFNKPKAGKYALKKGMSNNDIVNLLRSGNQTPVKVRFNNQDTLEKLANRIAAQVETDSTHLMHAFLDPTFLKENNFNKKTILGIFIPNRYEVYWTISAEKFRDKMLKEYTLFWNTKRIEKAKNLNLSKKEIITLASIVQKETAQKIERPVVAGLYLNRLKKGWPLQADPTVIFCIREKKGQNTVIKRVLTVDLKIDSPYNTYLNKGLPPGLISMPDVSAIDAVLNASKHNYFYMCANTEKIGFHAFSKTLSQHNRNAEKYHRWLNKKGINR